MSSRRTAGKSSRRTAGTKNALGDQISDRDRNQSADTGSGWDRHFYIGEGRRGQNEGDKRTCNHGGRENEYNDGQAKHGKIPVSGRGEQQDCAPLPFTCP